MRSLFLGLLMASGWSSCVDRFDKQQRQTRMRVLAMTDLTDLETQSRVREEVKQKLEQDYANAKTDCHNNGLESAYKSMQSWIDSVFGLRLLIGETLVLQADLRNAFNRGTNMEESKALLDRVESLRQTVSNTDNAQYLSLWIVNFERNANMREIVTEIQKRARKSPRSSPYLFNL